MSTGGSDVGGSPGGITRGLGLVGRGRGRITPERAEDSSRRLAGAGGLSGSSSVVINGSGHGKKKSFFTFDFSAKADDALGLESPGGSMTSGASSIAPQLVDPSIGIGMGINLPDRLVGGKAPVRIVVVDLTHRLGYIVFEDELSIKQRAGLSKKMAKLYGSDAGSRLVIPPECVNKKEVYVVRDEGVGAFHRAIILKTHPQKGAKLVDVDTYELFIVRKFVAYEMTNEISDLWFQVVACKFSLSETLLLKSWMESNKFIFSNEQIIESALLSTMEISAGSTLLASDICEMVENEQKMIRV